MAQRKDSQLKNRMQGLAEAHTEIQRILEEQKRKPNRSEIVTQKLEAVLADLSSEHIQASKELMGISNRKGQ